jgi:hypothetical protein
MKNFKTLIFLSVLATGLGMALWPDRPPEYLTIQITSLATGRMDRIEINGEPFDWATLGMSGVKTRLQEAFEALPKDRTPAVRIQIDDRQDWIEIRKLIDDVSQLEKNLDLFFVKTLEGEITPGEDIFNETSCIREGDIPLPDIEVDLEASDPVQVRLGTANLGNGDKGRAQLAVELQKLVTEAGPDIALHLAVQVRVNGHMPFGEIRQTLLAVSGSRTANGRWVPLIHHVGVWGLGCGYEGTEPVE